MTTTYVLIDREEDAFTVRVSVIGDGELRETYARTYDNLRDAKSKAQRLARDLDVPRVDTNFGWVYPAAA